MHEDGLSTLKEFFYLKFFRKNIFLGVCFLFLKTKEAVSFNLQQRSETYSIKMGLGFFISKNFKLYQIIHPRL